MLRGLTTTVLFSLKVEISSPGMSQDLPEQLIDESADDCHLFLRDLIIALKA